MDLDGDDQVVNINVFQPRNEEEFKHSNCWSNSPVGIPQLVTSTFQNEIKCGKSRQKNGNMFQGSVAAFGTDSKRESIVQDIR